jgi:signal transduction histidine kinase
MAPQLKFGGTGLGLTISNKLLELMESHLQLSSEMGGSW